mgnify:CR=1 FL=1
MGKFNQINNTCSNADSLESLKTCIELKGLECIDECKKALGKAWDDARSIDWPAIRERALSIIERRLSNIKEVEKELNNLKVNFTHDFEITGLNPPTGVIRLFLSNDNKIFDCDVKVNIEGDTKKLNIDGESFTKSIAAGSSEYIEINVKAPKPGSYRLVIRWEATYRILNKVHKGEDSIEVEFPEPKESKVKEITANKSEVVEQRGTKNEASQESKIQQPQPVVNVQSPQQPQVQKPSINVGDLISEAFKHVAVALVGFTIGGLMPEVRRFEKPVYVDDVPYVNQNDVTVILEDQSNVIIEDRGDVVIIRRPRLVELINQVSIKTAKSLIDDFRQRALNTLPSLRLTDGEVDWREEDYTSDYVEKIIEKERSRGTKVEEEELATTLPKLFKLEVRYGLSGVIRKRAKLRLIAGSYARIEKLYFYKNDHEPLNINEALEGLKINISELYTGAEENVLLLASPSGWVQNSIDQAKRGMGGVKLILINLKTGEAYYNPEDALLRTIVESLGYGEAAVIYNDYIRHLDKMLIAGEIDESVYRSKIAEALKTNP